MSPQKISNVPLRTMRRFLQNQGFEKVRTKGGHETWTQPGITRGVTLQTHIDPVPEFIVKQIIETCGLSRDQFLKLI